MSLEQYLIRARDLYGGVEFYYEFPNNYSVLVIQHDGTKNYKLKHWTMITYFNDVKISIREDLKAQELNSALRKVLEMQ